MADPTLEAPDVGNLTVSKGVLTFKAEGEVAFRDLGNAPEIELTLDITTLDHYTSRAGVRSKDHQVVLERTGTVRFVLEEWVPANLALWGMGTVDELAAGGPSFDIMSEDAISGELKFTGTNEVGVQVIVHLHNIRITPSASLNLIQDDDWGGIEVTAEVLLSQSTSKFGTMQVINIPSET